MRDDELQRAVQGLDSPDRLERENAAFRLAASADHRAFEALMAMVEDRERGLPLEQDAAGGFVKGAPATIPLLIPRYMAAPKSPAGDLCGYALGEIAYSTRTGRSSRIDEALFTVLRRVAEMGSRSADMTIYSLRQCAYARPVREATPWLWRLLERSGTEPHPSSWHLRLAMEALEAAEGDSVVPRLLELKGTIDVEHELATDIDLFMQQRQEPDDYRPWRHLRREAPHPFLDARAPEDEFHRFIDGIGAMDPPHQRLAFYGLSRSANPRAFEFTLARLREPTSWFIDESCLVDGLIDGAPATIPVAASHYLAAPASREGVVCGYALSEIAYRSKGERDPRIDAALLSGLEQMIDQGTDVASRTIEALHECARSKPVQGSTPLLWRVLERGRAETDPNPWCLRMALLSLEALAAAGGEALSARLQQLCVGLAQSHPLATLAEEFLPH